MTEASRKLYGGLDLHSSNVYCGIVDQGSNRVFAKRLRTNRAEILYALEPYRSQMQAIAVESTYNWYWLVDDLLEAKYLARLANPAAMQQYTGLKVSTDRSDAFWLAEMLRLDILPEGYIYPQEIRPVRDMLRRRLLMRRQRTQMLLSLQSMIQRQTSKKFKSSKLGTWTKQEAQECFSDDYSRETAWVMVQSIQKQSDLLKQLERSVLDRLEKESGYSQVTQIPGIGEILGMTIRLGTGRIDRFASAGNYASYCRTVRRSELLTSTKLK